jgi:tetratricopeptide (TPR) repeat protein
MRIRATDFAVAWCALGGILGLAASSAHAQTIHLKDGRAVTSKSLRRQGDIIMATQEIAGAKGQPATKGEVGYPVATIEKIDFPEPAQLRAATELLTQGRAAEAIAQVDVALRYYEGFRDAPGSWWADLALLKTRALVNEGHDKEADALVDQIARMANDPETVRAARVQVAAGMARRGEHARALELCEAVIKESTNPETLAAAAISKGESHLGLKQWEDALLSFLQIPVFHPEKKLLLPSSLLGTGRAYFGIQDLPRAKDTLDELIKNFGGTAEAVAAKTELEKIARLEQALAPPK